MKSKSFVFVVVLAIVVSILSACESDEPYFNSEDVTRENVVSLIDKLPITVYSSSLYQGTIPEKTDMSVSTGNTTFMYEMPSIDNYDVDVKGTGNYDVEIFLPLEDNGSGIRKLVDYAATEFNKANFTLDSNNSTISVSIRCLESPLAEDFIRTGVYYPKGYISSNEIYGLLMEENGIPATKIVDRIVGNTMGIAIKNEKYDEIVQKYGDISIKVIIDANMAGDLAIGYTNPTNNPTGLNFVVSMLSYFDASNPFSMEATTDFSNFQHTVPSVSYSTTQMKEAVERGAINAFVMERQAYESDTTLVNSYRYIPFGMRHDYPIYGIGDLSAEEIEVIQKFGSFFESDEMKNYASSLMFNLDDEYKSTVSYLSYNGGIISEILNYWKQEKSSGKKIAAVFLADTSGSMRGRKIEALKASLLNAMQYVNDNNMVGLMSYDSRVYIDVPISEFTTTQQEYFAGAVEHMRAGGGTATNNALLIALKLLDEEMEKDPDIKPIIILLSDGYTESGYRLVKVQNLMEMFDTPIYTIGYEADVKELEKIASINNGVFINASSDDVGYILKTLFNAEM